MLAQIIRDFVDTYDAYRGTGKILVLFVLSLLFLYMNRDAISFNPFALVLSPLTAVSSSASLALSKVKGAWSRILAIFLCGFIILLSGERLYSSEMMRPAQNSMHLPADYVAVMDYLLTESDNPSVLAMPEYSLYHSMYSSKFNMLYEQHENADIRYLSEDARDAYTQLSDRNPDMMVVAEAASASGIEYIVLKSEHYWSEFPLDRFGYPLYATLDGWDIYKKGGK